MHTNDQVLTAITYSNMKPVFLYDFQSLASVWILGHLSLLGYTENKPGSRIGRLSFYYFIFKQTYSKM